MALTITALATRLLLLFPFLGFPQTYEAFSAPRPVFLQRERLLAGHCVQSRKVSKTDGSFPAKTPFYDGHHSLQAAALVRLG
jgi:hypothetical protein